MLLRSVVSGYNNTGNTIHVRSSPEDKTHLNEYAHTLSDFTYTNTVILL